MNLFGVWKKAYSTLGILTFYKKIYTWLGFFVKAKKFEKAPQDKKYGIVIAARNEELVIGNLVDSLHAQEYPRENFRVFVVADNCDPDDRTAEIASEHGATVYERHCPEKARKGWALEYLFEKIEEDFGIQSFDGYLFFDADNVVSKDYLEKMNNAFCTGADGVIGYRNSKNFEQNWISAHYAIHFMRSSMTLHRPRSRMGLGTHIAGTGYLLSSDMLKDGWHYSTLTEDTQATMDFAVQGKRIEYCEEAEFFDEQPYQIKVMLRQRLRWAKGRMACFFRYGFKLFFGLVKPFKSKPEQKSEATNKAKPVRIGEGFDEPFGKMNLWKKIVFLGSCVMDICSLVVDWFAMGFRYIAKNFTNFDMIFYLIPLGFIYRMIFIAFDIYFFWLGWQQGSLLAAGLGPVATKVLQMLFGTLATYIKNIIKGLVIVVREWKHIRCPIWKMPFYLITWPLHDMIYPYICLASLFMHVTWKPIKHDVVKSIDEMNQ